MHLRRSRRALDASNTDRIFDDATRCVFAHLSDLHLRDEADAVELDRQLDSHRRASPSITWSSPAISSTGGSRRCSTRPRRARRARIADPRTGHHHPRQPRSRIERRPSARAARPPARWRCGSGIRRRCSAMPTGASIDGSRPARRALAHRAAVPRSGWLAASRSPPSTPCRYRGCRSPFAAGGITPAACPRSDRPDARLEWLAAAARATRLVVLIHHYPLDAGSQLAYDRWRSQAPIALVVASRIGGESSPCRWRSTRRSGTVLVGGEQSAGAFAVFCGHVHRARLDHHRRRGGRAERTERCRVGRPHDRVLSDRGSRADTVAGRSQRPQRCRRDAACIRAPTRASEQVRQPRRARAAGRGAAVLVVEPLLAGGHAGLDAQAEPPDSPIRTSTSTRRSHDIPARSRRADSLRAAPADSRRRREIRDAATRGERQMTQVPHQRPVEQ